MRCCGRSRSCPPSTPTGTPPGSDARCSTSGRRGNGGPERIAALERHARFAELSGELAEAARAQREVATARRSEGAGRALADAERHLAAIYELQGDRGRALTARCVAADAYAANGVPGEAAAERLRVAGFLQSAGRHADAVEQTRLAGEEAARAERADLRARVLGLQGVARVRGGEFDAGMETIRAGLSLALEHELTLETAELYQRLSTAQETAGNYGGAREALTTALGFCEASGAADDVERVCRGCMAYVLRELGDWERAAELSEDLRSPGARPDSTFVADSILGSIHLFRGDFSAARPLLVQSVDTAIRLDVISVSVDGSAALAWLDELEGDVDRARGHCRFLLERSARSEEHHYAVSGLRWASCFFARHGWLGEARACAEGLSRVATATGHPDALAALAHALGETALAEGHPDAAAQQIGRAAELHASLDIPFERAQIQLRAGVALAAAGQREDAVERLCEAHRSARRLGAAPVAAQAAAELAGLGESVRAATRAARGGRPRERRTVPPRARGDAPGGLGRYEPGDRGRARAQHPHGGHARAQHPHQAPLPVAHRGRRQGRRPRPARLASERPRSSGEGRLPPGPGSWRQATARSPGARRG